MTDRSRRERTIGGLAGRVVGKAKEALAGATGTPDLPSEGANGLAGAGLAGADPQAQAERTAAQRSMEAAEQVRVAATEEANRLEREAREAERVTQERKLD